MHVVDGYVGVVFLGFFHCVLEDAVGYAQDVAFMHVSQVFSASRCEFEGEIRDFKRGIMSNYS